MTMSAASAASAVGAPKAIPRSASASAGASLLPSPIMATRSCALSRRMTAALASGRHAGVDFVDMLAVSRSGCSAPVSSTTRQWRRSDSTTRAPGRARAVAREDGAFGDAVPTDVGDDGFAVAALSARAANGAGDHPAERGERCAAADGDTLTAHRATAPRHRMEFDLAGAAGWRPKEAGRWRAHGVRRAARRRRRGRRPRRADHDHRHLAAGSVPVLIEGDDDDAQRLRRSGPGDDDAAAQRLANRRSGGERMASRGYLGRRR